MTNNAEFLGEKIKEIRKRNGLSQEEFAFRLDVSRQTVYFWESGKAIPDSSKLLLICKNFNVDANELLFNNGEKKIDDKREKTVDDIEKSEERKVRGKLSRKNAIRLMAFSIILLVFGVILTAIGFFSGNAVSATDLGRVSTVQLNLTELVIVIGLMGTIIATVLLGITIKTLIKTKKKNNVNADNV